MLDEKKILKDICSFFGVDIDKKVIDLYLKGFLPNILNYEKLDEATYPLTAFQRYLIGFSASIYVNQEVPFQFYDIFRSCRHSISLKILHQRLYLIKNIKGYQERIDKLITARTYDEFEAIFFELITASKYAEYFGPEKVIFLKESDKKQPDFSVDGFFKFYVECKRANRSSDSSYDIRKKIRELHSVFAEPFVKSKKSALFSLELSKLPFDVEVLDWSDAFSRALLLQNGMSIETSFGSIRKDELNPVIYSEPKFYPSVTFFKDRYDFVEGRPWQALTQFGEFGFSELNIEGISTGPASSFLSSINNEITLKWKLSEELNNKIHKKLNFNQLFKGIEQLSGNERTVLHFCFERDAGVGHRKETLLKLLDQMKIKSKDYFGWIIFNEIQFIVSPKGRFDMQEHAHPVSGPLRFSDKPPAACVFTNAEIEDLTDNLSFGVGHALEDIDNVFDNPKTKK